MAYQAKRWASCRLSNRSKAIKKRSPRGKDHTLLKIRSKIRGLLLSRVYIGRDPRSLGPGSIVVFPLQSDTLPCGLAGIITIKKTGSASASSDGDQAPALFSSIRKAGLREILSGAVPARDFLLGAGPLERLKAAICRWKLQQPFEDIFFDTEKSGLLKQLSDAMLGFISEQESVLQDNAARLSTEELETVNARLILLKDLQWGLERDILQNIKKISDLALSLSPRSLRIYRQVNFLLNCLDRLEVRGRDSAGIQVFFELSRESEFSAALEKLREQGVFKEYLDRSEHGDLRNGSIDICREAGRISASFTYKTASIIGELGRNVRELRASIRSDTIFHLFAGLATDFDVSFAHTRWASVGSITEENCHPVNNFVLRGHSGDLPPGGLCAIPSGVSFSDRDDSIYYPAYGSGKWCISAAMNGDIDNFPVLRAELENSHGVRIAPELTTDTKIIPVQIDKYLREGKLFQEAFRLSLNDFEGSHAIAVISNLEPGKVFLSLRGSGQSVYVGICPDQYVFSSELYGIVEATSRFLKMDGESTDTAGNTAGGQIFVLDQAAAGGLEGIKAFYYSGEQLRLADVDIKEAEITTRDIDRGNFPHFFLKEISESAMSVRKTLLGKYRLSRRDSGWELDFNLGEDILPSRIREGLKSRKICNIVVIGHGTAAVAGTAIADGMQRCLNGSKIKVEARRASELSGFFLADDLHDTLIIPVTQSGTTTDTNRAVSMAVERGAYVIAVVNRRQSDITHKSAGVFYTSDGRDIEMSVASTKAFYSQIVAGHVLGLALADVMGTLSRDSLAEELFRLEQIPEMMGRTLQKQDEIKESVLKTAKQKKYWAVVGSGPNKAAADEVRIKLSELCYKTISSDVIEDKKHIDLSSEPLIIVCAAGNPESVLGDIVKDVAIFKAHKASVVVFADEGENRFDGIADSVITLPRAAMPLPVILNTLAGHLWGYYAACNINDDAAFFREFRKELSRAVIEQDQKNYTLYQRLFDRRLHRVLNNFSEQFIKRKNSGAFTTVNARTIADISLLTKYVAGKLPLEDFWVDFSGGGENVSPIDLLNIAFGQAIDELSRPIDAIRHQAKTVTVGTSRKEEILRGRLFDLIWSLKFAPKSLKTENILEIDRVQKAVAGVRGFTLYEIDRLDSEGAPTEETTISILERQGIALQMRSRVEKSKLLMGAKRTIVRTGHVYIGRGNTDGVPIIIIPLLGTGQGVRNLLLIHIVYNEALSLTEKIHVLGCRVNDIRNIVNEYNLPWNDAYIEPIPLESIFSEPVEVIAGQIRTKLNA